MPEKITRIIPFRDCEDGLKNKNYPIRTIFALDNGEGKKATLKRAIEACESEWVWLQDVDVHPAEIVTEQEMLNLVERADICILPLRMTAGKGTLIERLQQAEYGAIQQLTYLTAKKNRAVMCSGANLLVNRKKWLESYADLHPDIPSGDDMFLLESFKRRHLRITTTNDPHFEAIVTPQPTLKQLLRQRMRWAGKSVRYQDRDIILCGAIIVLANLLQLFCPLILLVKFPIEYALIRQKSREISFGIIFLLEIIYPFYVLFCLVGGWFRLKKW